MDIKIKTKQLQTLYQQFDEKARVHREAAVCAAGCADCCINVGNVDAVTLEGWLILERMKNMDPRRRSQLKQKIEENAWIKEESRYARCPFLLDTLRCGIYPVRPFSCRRLYSLARCGESGPTVHRLVWQMAEETIAALKDLDGSGCFGHLSHILQVLQDPQFRKAYLNGESTGELLRALDCAKALFPNQVHHRLR